MSRKTSNRNDRNGNSAINNPGNNVNPVQEFKQGSPQAFKKTEFQVVAGSAKSVLLAADFTGWEKSPLEMEPSENGRWRVEVPLPSGSYSYRFIVDGQWCDDPECTYFIPNAFGSANATRKVV